MTFRKSNVIPVTVLVLLFTMQLIYAQSSRVSIIPFTISAKDDLSHIQNGIYDLLSARFSIKDTVVIIAREETEATLKTVDTILGESLALIVGAKLKADYVVYGSLTVSGIHASIVMKVMDVTGGKPSLIFTEHLEGIDKVIPQINLYATEIINQKLLREKESGLDSGQIKDSLTLQKSQEVIKSDTIRSTADTTKPQKEDEKVTIPLDSVFSKDYWKSPVHKMLINGLALGDIDGDGGKELIVLTKKKIEMYRFLDHKLQKIKEIKKIKTGYPVSIDVADINGNGYPEIFVTLLDFSQTRANSFVLEFNGKQFVTIARNIRYYLRAVALNDTTHMLFGQSGSRAFSGKIFEMKWQESKYVSAKQILPSRRVNVLGLAYSDIMKKKNNSVLVYDSFDKINLFDSSGKKLWESDDAFGGNTLYFKIPKKTESSTEEIDYLPMRLQIIDINRDGLAEVIVVKNHAFARNMLGNIRHFKKSHIEIFAWDGNGLASQWKSGAINHYMRDFVIGDIDNDGKNEFVAALVLKQGKIVFAKPESSLIVYELE